MAEYRGQKCEDVRDVCDDVDAVLPLEFRPHATELIKVSVACIGIEHRHSHLCFGASGRLDVVHDVDVDVV